MRIATKSGDKGTTGRLFGTRVSKTSAAIAAVGDIDEFNAALGLLKSEMPEEDKYYPMIEKIQHALTLLMGEVAAETSRRAEYVSKYDYVKENDLLCLDEVVDELQDMSELDQQGWVLYGKTKKGALSDFAGKVCRRAERSFLVVVEDEQDEPLSAQCRSVLGKYLNRLSDFLHLLARRFDYIG